MMLLNMFIEFGDVFDYFVVDFWGWCGEVGFCLFEVILFVGGFSVVVVYK